MPLAVDLHSATSQEAGLNLERLQQSHVPTNARAEEGHAPHRQATRAGGGSQRTAARRPSWRFAQITRFLVPLGLTWACGRSDTPLADSTADIDRAQAVADTAALLGTGWVYTADEAGQSITRVDLRSGATTSIPIGIMAHNVQVVPEGRTIVAIGSAAMETEQHPDEADTPGTLLVLQADAADTAGMVRIPVGRGASHAVTSQDGRRAFTTNGGDNAVIVVDLDARRAVDTVRTGAYPHGLRLSPDGGELYVACVNANAVSVLDAQGGRELTRIPVGRAPVQVGFLPDGSRVYVTLRDENAVAVIDTRTRKVLRKIPVGRAPIQLMATPDGRFVYVANQGAEAQPDSTVSMIDVARDSVVATVTTGRGAHGVAVSTDGSRVFIANTFASTMSVIDARERRVLRSVPVGRAPGGISYRP